MIGALFLVLLAYAPGVVVVFDCERRRLDDDMLYDAYTAMYELMVLTLLGLGTLTATFTVA